MSDLPPQVYIWRGIRGTTAVVPLRAFVALLDCGEAGRDEQIINTVKMIRDALKPGEPT